MSFEPPSFPPPVATVGEPGVKAKRPIWRRWWAIAIVAVILLTAIGALAKKPAATTPQSATTTSVTSESSPTGDTVASSSQPTTVSTTTTIPAAAVAAANAADQSAVTIITVASPGAAVGVATQNMLLTPGALNPAVSQATIQSTICVTGYTAAVRNVTSATKSQVFAEYGITNPPSGAYEIDHLISLELGGSNDIRNLWPEPYTGADNAHDKDVWENKLHTQVCAGTITLAVAQDEIVHWWVLLGVAAAPVTVPPVTSPVVTAAPVIAPPVTAPPVIAPPVTAPPVIAPPVTQPPAPATGDIKPGAYCTPEGATGTYNGLSYICATTNASGVPYSGGRAHWRQG